MISVVLVGKGVLGYCGCHDDEGLRFRCSRSDKNEFRKYLEVFQQYLSKSPKLVDLTVGIRWKIHNWRSLILCPEGKPISWLVDKDVAGINVVEKL